MRRPWMVLVVVALAVGGCGDATGDPPSAATEQFTQGGVSMEPAVKAGQVITVRKTGADYQPKRGDVVVFHGDQAHWVGTSSPLLKRVVAVGGETVACCTVAGKVTVDGEPIDEPYVAEDAALEVPPNPGSCEPRRFGPVMVPKDTVFLMGDNRARSNDSRCAGPVPVTAVFGVMSGN
ncbi:signal peptidase I [Dactylosporangium cerinum]|uniref:Signal peptidase I n=1 Tax=Dactylosporangium cerinum TaxID=1434730 RepID=A0ABV9W9T6_9ACTN